MPVYSFEIEEKFAVAQNAALKVMRELEVSKGKEPGLWIRSMEVTKGTDRVFVIRCVYFVNGNHDEELFVDVLISHSPAKSFKAWRATVLDPFTGYSELWMFDIDGKAVKNRACS